MQENKKQKKENLSGCTDDLRIHRGFNVKLKTVNVMEPNVIEINISFYAIPTVDKVDEEYEHSINNIRKRYNRICIDYLHSNSELVGDKHITDFSFTSANLRKGYNKYVTMSLYVNQKTKCRFSRLKGKFRDTLKDVVIKLSEKLREEDFTYSKTKKVKRQK